MGILAGAIAALGGLGPFGSFFLQFIGSVVLSAVSRALMGKPQGFSPGPRTVMVRQPAQPWRIVYGQSRVSGVVVFMESTSRYIEYANDPDDTGTKALHLVVVLAGHEVDAITDVYFNDEVIELAEDGEAIGKYGGHAWVYKHTGAVGQAADASLIEWLPFLWTEDHRLAGHAYLYVRLIWDEQLYPSLPEVSAVVRGRKVYDPRDGGTRWSDNNALCIRDYLIDQEIGCQVDAADIDDDAVEAAANACDERVAVTAGSEIFVVGPQTGFSGYTSHTYKKTNREGDQVTKTTEDVLVLDEGIDIDTGDAVILAGSALPAGLSAGTVYYAIADARNTFENDTSRNRIAIRLATSLANAEAGTAVDITADGTGTIARASFLIMQGDAMRHLQTGDAVRVSSTGTLPAPLAAATDYYVIRERKANEENRSIRLATSAANARAGTAIALTSLGSGTHTVNRASEARYSCNGTFESSMKRDEVLAALVGSMAGKLVYTAGKWRMLAGVWRAAVGETLTIDAARGPVRVTSLVPRRERFNAVKGTYWSPSNYDQPADFPSVESAAYAAADGGTLWQDLSLPFTNSPSMAQRIAKIMLYSSREELTVAFPCLLGPGYRYQAGDNVTLTLARYGWTEKIFEIASWSMSAAAGEDGAPAPGVDLVLREASSAIYDWSTAEEGEPPPAPNTSLPSPFATPGVPGQPVVTEALYESQTGAGLKNRVTLTWTESEGLAARYEVQHRAVGATEWAAVSPVPATQLTASIDDVPTGAREFRVRAVSRAGRPSHWTDTVTYTVIGLSEPPATPTGFSLRPLNGHAHLIWDRHPALDVRIGGRFEVRHAPVLTGATWATASPLETEIAGQATEATVALATGTYLLKAVDSSGNESESPASAVTTLPDLLHYNVVETLTEHPDWSGTKTGCEVSGSSLVLSTESLVDDWGDWDAIDDFDAGEGFQSDGTYRFGPVDLGQVYPVRLRAHLVAAALVLGTTIDERTHPIDSWEDIDGASSPNAPVSAALWVRATDDDPAGTPAWGAWIPFLAVDLVGRGFEFELRLESADTNVGVQVSECEIVLDMPDRTDMGDVTTGTGADTSVTFSPAFKAAPKVGGTIQNGATGDYISISSITRTGFNVSVYNSGAARIARNVSWIAKGYGLEA